MKCSSCGNFVDVPVSSTNVDSTGRIDTRITCTYCARYRHSVFFVDPAEVRPQELSSILKTALEFISTKERIPTFSDLPELISIPIILSSAYGTHELSKQIEYMNAVIQYIDRTDTIPLMEELPDPRYKTN